MGCEKCNKNLETREFDGKNLCYDCAIKLYTPKPFIPKVFNSGIKFPGELDEEGVKYKFSKTQEELDEEEYYEGLLEKIILKFKKQFVEEDIDGVINGIKSILKSKLHERGDFYENFGEFFTNDFQEGIFKFLRNKKILNR